MMDPWPLQNERGTRLDGSQLSQGTTRCLQLHFKGPKSRLLAQKPTKPALLGLLCLAKVQTANGMDPLPFKNDFGTIFEWVATATGHQRVSPGSPQWPALQLSVDGNQGKQARHAQQKLKPT